MLTLALCVLQVSSKQQQQYAEYYRRRQQAPPQASAPLQPNATPNPTPAPTSKSFATVPAQQMAAVLHAAAAASRTPSTARPPSAPPLPPAALQPTAANADRALLQAASSTPPSTSVARAPVGQPGLVMKSSWLASSAPNEMPTKGKASQQRNPLRQNSKNASNQNSLARSRSSQEHKADCVDLTASDGEEDTEEGQPAAKRLRSSK